VVLGLEGQAESFRSAGPAIRRWIVALRLFFAREEHVGGVGGGDVVGGLVAEGGEIEVAEDAFAATDEDR
jgi:hypothetical protein